MGRRALSSLAGLEAFAWLTSAQGAELQRLAGSRAFPFVSTFSSVVPVSATIPPDIAMELINLDPTQKLQLGRSHQKPFRLLDGKQEDNVTGKGECLLR